MDTARLIRDARYQAAYSQRELARRADISPGNLSRFETGKRVPSIAMLRRILAAAGRQIVADLEPLDEDIRRAAAEIEKQPLDDRPAVRTWALLIDRDQVQHRVEGIAAAAILGAPIPEERFDLALADDDSTFEWLSAQAMSWVGKIRAPGWHRFELVQAPAPDVREVIERHCPDGEFELNTVGFFGHVTMRPAADVARHTRVESSSGSIPVQPLNEIEATDPRVRRILAVLRDEPPATDAATPGTALSWPISSGSDAENADQYWPDGW